MTRLEELVLIYFSAVLCFCLADSSQKEEDVISQCERSLALCILDPPECQSMDDCKLAAIFAAGKSPNQISVKVRVRDPAPDPYVLLRFSEKPLQDVVTSIYCSPGPDPISFSFGSSGNQDPEFATEKESRRMAKVENVAVVDNILKCDFTRTVTAEESEIEANSVLKEQSLALMTGSRNKNGGYEKPHLSFVAPYPMDLKASLKLDVLARINEKSAGGPFLSLNGRRSRKGQGNAFRSPADAGTPEFDVVENEEDDNGSQEDTGEEHVGRKAAAVGSSMGIFRGGPGVSLVFMLAVHALIWHVLRTTVSL